MVEMPTVGGPSTPEGLLPHLVVRLKPGWKYRLKTGALRDESGEELMPDLEAWPGSRVIAMSPEIVRLSRKLTPDEEILSRYVLVILPEETDMEEARRLISEWDFVEVVDQPPEIGLPGGPSPPGPGV